MLALDDPRWGELSRAYGSAADTPILLRMLEADPNQVPGDPTTGEDTWSNLWISICHRGTAYSASYAAVPHLVRIASLAADLLPLSYLLLPAYIECGRVLYVYPAPMPSDLEESYFEAVAKLPQLIPRLVRADLGEWDALALASALLFLCGQWELGEGIRNITLVDVKRFAGLDADAEVYFSPEEEQGPKEARENNQ